MISAATELVLLGGAIVPFLNPIFVRFEQDRTGAGALTGYSPAQLDDVTGSLVADLVLWRGSFDVHLDGARGLAIGIAFVGTVVVLAFDAAFEVFHRLFFSAGSYTFDPRTDKLGQLFPEAFWSETAAFVGIIAIVAATVAWAIARRRTA